MSCFIYARANAHSQRRNEGGGAVVEGGGAPGAAGGVGGGAEGGGGGAEGEGEGEGGGAWVRRGERPQCAVESVACGAGESSALRGFPSGTVGEGAWREVREYVSGKCAPWGGVHGAR